MRKICVGFVIAILLLPLGNGFAFEKDFCNSSGYTHTYIYIPKEAQKAKYDSMLNNPTYISSYCESAAKIFKTRYGEISINLQTLLMGNKEEILAARGITDESLCSNTISNLKRMSLDDVTRFVVLLSVSINKNALDKDILDVNFHTSEGSSKGKMALIEFIAYIVCHGNDEVINGKKYIFWTKAKKDMLIDFMKGREMEKHFRHPLSEQIYTMLEKGC